MIVKGMKYKARNKYSTSTPNHIRLIDGNSQKNEKYKWLVVVPKQIAHTTIGSSAFKRKSAST